eukprot:CAMPEP_0172166460 /NCGR_PEP_ID=MMETSP1050-20130122/8992_1 /TAXON_ID=233186 /ORGANISM="Cryptomonas curvata, Strain CCAP979/52" /LENGTH=108 /DNA_ID=CAMNT_0012837069 /DNA_START=8 /DNA_END=334 /DNA_ORIENTATION=+
MAVRLAGGLSAAEEVNEELKALACSFQSAIEKERKVEYDAFMPLSFCTQVVAGTNYFVKVSTLICGGTRPNVNTILLLKLYKPLPHTGESTQLVGIKEIGSDDAIHTF